MSTRTSSSDQQLGRQLAHERGVHAQQIAAYQQQIAQLLLENESGRRALGDANRRANTAERARQDLNLDLVDARSARAADQAAHSRDDVTIRTELEAEQHARLAAESARVAAETAFEEQRAALEAEKRARADDRDKLRALRRDLRGLRETLNSERRANIDQLAELRRQLDRARAATARRVGASRDGVPEAEEGFEWNGTSTVIDATHAAKDMRLVFNHAARSADMCPD